MDMMAQGRSPTAPNLVDTLVAQCRAAFTSAMGKSCSVVCPSEIRGTEDARVMEVLQTLRQNGINATVRFDTSPDGTESGLNRAISAAFDFVAKLEGDRLVRIDMAPVTDGQR